MSEFIIIKNDTSLFKKVIFVISLAFILVILTSYSYNINAFFANKPPLIHLPSNNTVVNENNIPPMYISKFWENLSADKIPNNGEKYNCTATVQMLYARWLRDLARELGYKNVNEMLSYSLKVVKIKEIMDNIIQDPIKLTLSNYNSSTIKFIPPKEKEYWIKIYHILNSNYYSKLNEYDAIDNFLVKIGLIDNRDFKTSTWEVFELMSTKGYAVYEKMDKNGKRGIDIWRESKTYLPLDESSINVALPGDILTGKYYASSYRDKYTTHLTVYLGIRDEKYSFAEQFGEEARITSLEKMYTALRTGFEAIFRPVIIISKEKTQEFLTRRPLADYHFGSQIPQILFFKEEAEKFLFPIQISVNEVINSKDFQTL